MPHSVSGRSDRLDKWLANVRSFKSLGETGEIERTLRAYYTLNDRHAWHAIAALYNPDLAGTWSWNEEGPRHKYDLTFVRKAVSQTSLAHRASV